MRVSWFAAVLCFAGPVAQATTHHAAAHSSHPTPVVDCQKPEERAALEVEGLKSELIVTALSCDLHDKYNAFMARYQHDLVGSESVMNAYFKRVYGRQSVKAHDDYITNLANVQSQEGIKSGVRFCGFLSDMFDEVMSLHDSTELDDFARGQPIPQPIAFNECPASPEPIHPVRRRHGKSVRTASN